MDPISALVEAGKTAIDKLIPDANIREKRKADLDQMASKKDLAGLSAELQLMLGQIEINKVEAKSKSLFVAGWRPFIGWCGGFSLAYSGLMYPLLLWVWPVLVFYNLVPAMDPPPFVEAATLTAIVGGMLGIGGMRSFDKRNGTQTDRI